MSKMDELRALREARYAQRPTAAPKPAPNPAPKAAGKTAGKGSPAPRSTAPATAEATAAADPEVALCGHRAISGRTCTREQGHSAKSHRYS
jgi:hypothetical protein